MNKMSSEVVSMPQSFEFNFDEIVFQSTAQNDCQVGVPPCFSCHSGCQVVGVEIKKKVGGESA